MNTIINYIFKITLKDQLKFWEYKSFFVLVFILSYIFHIFETQEILFFKLPLDF